MLNNLLYVANNFYHFQVPISNYNRNKDYCEISFIYLFSLTPSPEKKKEKKEEEEEEA